MWALGACAGSAAVAVALAMLRALERIGAPRRPPVPVARGQLVAAGAGGAPLPTGRVVVDATHRPVRELPRGGRRANG
jgi:hypothetical protein